MTTVQTRAPAPTDLLHSALFAAIQLQRELSPQTRQSLLANPDSPPQPLTALRVYSTDNLYLTYAGPQLSQFDLDVWLAVLSRFPVDLATKKRIFTYEPFNVTLSELGKWMHRKGRGNDDLNRRRESLERLAAGRLMLSKRANGEPWELVATTGLLLTAHLSHGLMQVSLDPKVATLFESATLLDLKIRASLAQKPLTAYFYAWLTSHGEDVAGYGLVKLFKLTGAKGSDAPTPSKAHLKDFKFRLNLALTELRDTYKVLHSFNIEDKMVFMYKTKAALDRAVSGKTPAGNLAFVPRPDASALGQSIESALTVTNIPAQVVTPAEIDNMEAAEAMAELESEVELEPAGTAVHMSSADIDAMYAAEALLTMAELSPALENSADVDYALVGELTAYLIAQKGRATAFVLPPALSLRLMQAIKATQTVVTDFVKNNTNFKSARITGTYLLSFTPPGAPPPEVPVVSCQQHAWPLKP